MQNIRPVLVSLSLSLAHVEDHEAALLVPADESIVPQLLNFVGTAMYPYGTTLDVSFVSTITTTYSYDIFFVMHMHIGYSPCDLPFAGHCVEMAVAQRIADFFHYNAIKILNISFS